MSSILSSEGEAILGQYWKLIDFTWLSDPTSTVIIYTLKSTFFVLFLFPSINILLVTTTSPLCAVTKMCPSVTIFWRDILKTIKYFWIKLRMIVYAKFYQKKSRSFWEIVQIKSDGWAYFCNSHFIFVNRISCVLVFPTVFGPLKMIACESYLSLTPLVPTF